MSLGTVTLSEDDMKIKIDNEINELASLMKLSVDQVESILYQNSWNKDLVLQV